MSEFDSNFPDWVYAIGGLIVVGAAYHTGSRVGALMIVLVLLVMVGNAYKKGVVKNV